MNNAVPAIHIQNACLCYANKILFDQLSVTIAAGKFTCLLGASGVGKSSLLRLISGLIDPETLRQTQLTGYVKASDDKPLAGRVAYLAQADSLLPWLTVIDNVVIGDKLRGQQPDFARARQLLAQVELTDSLALRPNQLSGGMRQRVALARTLYEDRPLVLMDEPFAALDSITRIRLQELAARLLANRTVLLVTHDPLEALRLGHQLYIMAGNPAILRPFTELPDSPPRQLDNDKLLHWQAELLQQLSMRQALV